MVFPNLLHKAITSWTSHALYYLVKTDLNVLNPEFMLFIIYYKLSKFTKTYTTYECRVKHPQKCSLQKWMCAAPSSCFCLCTCVHISVIQLLCCMCGFPHLPESPQLFAHNPRPKQIPLAIQAGLQPWSFHMKRGERWPAAERSTGVNVLTSQDRMKNSQSIYNTPQMYVYGWAWHSWGQAVLNCYHCCVGSVKAAWSLWAGW